MPGKSWQRRDRRRILLTSIVLDRVGAMVKAIEEESTELDTMCKG